MYTIFFIDKDIPFKTLFTVWFRSPFEAPKLFYAKFKAKLDGASPYDQVNSSKNKSKAIQFIP